MGKRESAASEIAQTVEIGYLEALKGSDAKKVEALWEIVEMHEESGCIPEGVGIMDVAVAAMEMKWGEAGGNMKNTDAEGLARSPFNLKLRLSALMDAEAKTANSALILGVFCGGKVKFDLTNVSFARGTLISAFGARQYSREAIEAALNFIRSDEAVCPEDKETMLGALLEAQRLGADLSSAKSALEGIAGSGGEGKKRTEILARSILLGIEGGGDASLLGLARRSWTPRGHTESRGSGPVGRARGKGEPTGKIRV